jgi:hypothetical protein
LLDIPLASSFQSESFLDAVHRALLQLFFAVHRKDGAFPAVVNLKMASFLGAERASLLFQPSLEFPAVRIFILT